MQQPSERLPCSWVLLPWIMDQPGSEFVQTPSEHFVRIGGRQKNFENWRDAENSDFQQVENFVAPLDVRRRRPIRLLVVLGAEQQQGRDKAFKDVVSVSDHSPTRCRRIGRIANPETGLERIQTNGQMSLEVGLVVRSLVTELEPRKKPRPDFLDGPGPEVWVVETELRHLVAHLEHFLCGVLRNKSFKCLLDLSEALGFLNLRSHGSLETEQSTFKSGNFLPELIPILQKNLNWIFQIGSTFFFSTIFKGS